jgi:hypothetical protein
VSDSFGTWRRYHGEDADYEAVKSRNFRTCGLLSTHILMLRLRPLASPLCIAGTNAIPRWSRRKLSDVSSHLNSVTEEDVAHFARILPATAILSTFGASPVTESELASYNNDWMGKYRGTSRVVLRPKTTQQVSEIVKYCNERRIGVVPQGGNTGLVGGSVPINDEVIINLGGMSNIRSFDNVSGEARDMSR